MMASFCTCRKKRTSRRTPTPSMSTLGAITVAFLLVSQTPTVSSQDDYPNGIDLPDLTGLLNGFNFGNLSLTDLIGSLQQSNDITPIITSLLTTLGQSGFNMSSLPELPSGFGSDVGIDREYLTELYDQFFSDLAVSEQCSEDLITFIADLMNNEPYARKMYGSFGSLPTENAQYTGVTKNFGIWWQCRELIRTNGTPTFDTEFCMLKSELGEQFNFEVATCMPDTCNQYELKLLFNRIPQLYDANAEGEPFHVECMTEVPWKGTDIFVVFILCVFGALVIAGSVYDVFFQKQVAAILSLQTSVPVENDNHTSKQDPDTAEMAPIKSNGGPDEAANSLTELEDVDLKEGEEGAKPQTLDVDEGVVVKPRSTKLVKFDQFMMAFSAVTNARKILSTKSAAGTMGVLNGLRVLSMFWIILGHSVQFILSSLRNPLELAEMGKEFSALAIGNATVAVDTFFVLSGFLVTYLTLKALYKKDGQISWGLLIFHRWWRLTPVYMVTMGIWAALAVHFGQAIYKEAYFTYYVTPNCDKYWWTQLAYINNLYPFKQSLNQTCMGWGWYLACDMQFFLISPIIITLLYKRKRLGIASLVVLTLVSLFSLLGINIYYGYSVNAIVQGNYNDRLETDPGDYYYTKPYTRIHTYLVGMALGYIMYTNKDKQMKIPAWGVVVGWTAALMTLFAVVYGTWADRYERYIPQAESVLYLTFNRFAWSVAIAWLIFACIAGYGGPINAFLSWKLWIPLGRLTYCAYLFHPILIINSNFDSTTLFQFSYVSISYFYVGNLVFSYAAALILSLLVEGPCMGLEKLLIPKQKRD